MWFPLWRCKRTLVQPHNGIPVSDEQGASLNLAKTRMAFLILNERSWSHKKCIILFLKDTFSYMKAIVIERRSVASGKEDAGILDYKALTSGRVSTPRHCSVHVWQSILRVYLGNNTHRKINLTLNWLHKETMENERPVNLPEVFLLAVKNCRGEES